MKAINLPKITFWRAVAVSIVVMGLYSTILRFATGLQQTAMKDDFPWGLWIGFDVLCGVGLAAGGFTICAVTHIFNIKQFKPLTKPAILTAFLGYVLVVVGLLMDLGKPWNIWHAIIMWNFNSVMFEVAWCVMLYTTVLFLEFVPVVLERFKLFKLQSILKKVAVPIYILGIILSTLHQSSLGSLFLILPTKMNPLWYSSLLPVYFYLSAIAVGFAMIIFEAFLSARAFDKELELDLLSKIGFISVIFLAVTLVLKAVDFTLGNKWVYLTQMNQASLLFMLEVLIGVIVPFGLLISKKVRENKKWLYIASCMIVGGFIFNRLNVSITAVSDGTGIFYFPSFTEISITLMLVVLGMWAFRLIVKNFPVFHEPVRS